MFYKKKFVTLFILFFSFSLYSQIIFETAEEAAAYALINSPNFNYQRLNAELGMKIAKNSIESFLPSFNVSWADNKSLNYFSPDSSNKSFSVSVSQFVFDGGKRALSYDMQKSSSLYNYKTYLQSEKNFCSEIMAQYYQCLSQQKKIEIKKELESLAEDHLLILKTEYELGRALENDYLEYLISFKKIQNERMQYEREYRTLMRNFKIALNLDPEVEIKINENTSSDAENGFNLEEYCNFLWNRYKSVNIELQQQDINLVYAKKELEISKRQYIPDISVEADVSFSGDSYPLTAPSYNVKLNISFSGFPILPVSLGGGLGINNYGKLSSARNDSSVAISPQINYSNSLKSAQLALNKKIQENKDTVNTHYATLFDAISNYDDSNTSVLIYEETIGLQERRLQIALEQVNSGLLSRIDYLDRLTELSNQKIELETAKNNHALLRRNIEIMLDIPFGGLHDVCKANK